MTNQIVDTSLNRNKEPVRDISFFKKNVLYIKPHPTFGAPSTFWPSGIRPRVDSTGLDICPPVAKILPKLDLKSYEIALTSISDTWRLHGNFNNYKKWVLNEINSNTSLLCPLIDISIPFDKACVSTFGHLCEIATDIFDFEIHKITDSSILFSETHQSFNYILLTCIEIGKDKANDISTIEHITEIPNFEKITSIVDGERLKFEYGLAIASAYCIKFNADCVYYIRDDRYKWV